MANVGFREILNFKRPDAKLVEMFRGIPSSNIDDNMSRLYGVARGLVPFNHTPLLGPAFTVKVPAGDNLMFHRALDIAKPGDILVIDGGGGTDRALCGEIMVRYAMHRKLGGFVVNGYIRDSEAIAKLDFPVYALGKSPNGPYKNGPGEIGVPVVAGGIAILPGDILAGDFDGVAVIRQEVALEIAVRALEQNRREIRDMEAIKNDTMDRNWVKNALDQKGADLTV